jgi:hypothetical protein
MESTRFLKAIVIGASGATGRELVDLLLLNSNFSKVTILIRRKIGRWDNLAPELFNKLNIIEVESLDILNKEKETISKVLNEETNYDCLFCTLGASMKLPIDEYKKIESQYYVNSAKLCETFNIPHFSSITSKAASSSSWIEMAKVQGLRDETILKSEIESKCILRAGLIQDRDNDKRLSEKLLDLIPSFLLDKITSKNLAKAMMNIGIHHVKNESGKKQARIVEHKEQVKWAEMNL